MAQPQNQFAFPPQELGELVNQLRAAIMRLLARNFKPDTVLLTEADSDKFQALFMQFELNPDQDKLASITLDGLQLRIRHMQPWQEQELADATGKASSMVFQATDHLLDAFGLDTFDGHFSTDDQSLYELPVQFKTQGLRDVFQPRF